jgi:hypothetical protein
MWVEGALPYRQCTPAGFEEAWRLNLWRLPFSPESHREAVIMNAPSPYSSKNKTGVAPLRCYADVTMF